MTPSSIFQRSSKIKGLLGKIEVDRAVFFGLSSKVWGMLAGPLTAILIVAHFTPKIQGYYYTFWSLLNLQAFIELGLGIVLISFSSHEWSQLRLNGEGEIEGDHDAYSRLASLARISLIWYSVGAVIIAFGVGVGGYIFFKDSPNYVSSWEIPWFLLCLLSGLSILFVPVWSILEGCNQVSSLYTYKFFQSVFSRVAIWIAILLGSELWTPSISIAVTLIFSGLFIRHKYWKFSKSLFLSHNSGSRVKWREDLFPMQWRVAGSWISGYFAFSLFSPLAFKFGGPVIAGQLGMTWSLIGIILTIPSSWTAPKIPQFGILIAQRRYDELNRLFWRIVRVSITGIILTGITVWCFVYFLYHVHNPVLNKFGLRLLSPFPTAIFIIAQIIQSISMPFSAYLRAHKKEPLLLISVLFGLTTAASITILGKYFSVTGMSFGYLMSNIIFVPLIFLKWQRLRTKWHGDKVISEMA